VRLRPILRLSACCLVVLLFAAPAATGHIHASRQRGAPAALASGANGGDRTSAPVLKAMRGPDYRSCIPSEPALAMVADLHRVSFRTACRVTKKLVSYPWTETDRVKITRWCWNDLGGVSTFDGWNVKVRDFHGPATLSKGGRWFAFQGQEFPISCV